MNRTIKKRIFKLLSFAFMFALLAPSVKADAASDLNITTTEQNAWPEGPDVYADAAIVMEVNTGLILYEKDIYSSYYPASITKIMTTLLALENCNLNETVTMSREAEWDVDFNSSRIGLVEGEQISLEDALYGVMLESANEVSYAVGEHIAGGPITDFSVMMNERANELGAVNTNFVNPNGLHDDNHYTCAYDMALISRAAIQIPEFRTITGARTYTIPATNKNVARPLANHHRFIKKTIEYAGTIGGKTGGTAEAKTTLVTFAERNGLTLVAVVLHVDTGLHAYEDTANILDFAFENYTLYDMAQTELTEDSSFPNLFSSVPAFSEGFDTNLRFGDNSSIVLPVTANYEDASKTIEFYPVKELEHGDNVIGQATYTYQNKFVGSTDIIYYNEAYPLTQTVFNSLWPDYLLSPEEVFSDSFTVSTPTLIPASESSLPNTEDSGVQKDNSDSSEIVADTENSQTENTDDMENNTESVTVSSDSVTSKKTKIKLTLLLIFVTITALLIILYLMFIELPHRKKRRTYFENHRRRMSDMRKSIKDDFN